MRNEKNLGLVGNHNRCIEVSETKYVNVWHDDDIMMPENLERKIGILESNNHVGLVFSNVERVDEEGRTLPYIWHEECERDYIEDGKVIFRKYLDTMHRGALFFIGSVVARKAWMIKAGGFRPDYSSLTCDSEMWLRMLLFSHGACLGEPLVKYRQYTGNTTSQYYEINFLEEHFKVVEKVFKECQDQIPDWKTLKREVGERFLKEALRRGLKISGRDDLDMAHEYLRWTRRFSQDFVWSKDYWRLQLRLGIGPKGLRLCRSVKTRLKEML
jgi:glycosyltransferase involved in cell wall biosynthesis